MPLPAPEPTTTRSDAPLAFRGVRLQRAGRVVLDHVSLEVKGGEIVVLLGPSGAGKTSLLRIAMGFLRPDEGEVWVAGTDVAGLDGPRIVNVRQRAGIVFQNAALFTSMDVEENVAFGLAESGLTDRDVHDRVERTLQAAGLHDLAHRMPEELSSGQAQRVAVARAIVSEPEVMLYDEPTQGLDPRRGLELVEQITRLARSGVASLVVTHQLEYWRRAAHRVALLENGVIGFDVAPTQLRSLDHPFVRSFFELLDVPPGEGRRASAG